MLEASRAHYWWVCISLKSQQDALNNPDDFEQRFRIQLESIPYQDDPSTCPWISRNRAQHLVRGAGGWVRRELFWWWHGDHGYRLRLRADAAGWKVEEARRQRAGHRQLLWGLPISSQLHADTQRPEARAKVAKRAFWPKTGQNVRAPRLCPICASTRLLQG